ncbi:hypothetical protein P3T37_003709 [Kitasatospora sp. MAA4]|uniref:hypothetical protein n=1 Tax=Kitasatospora sp. MAA4 TaxID=3035093 RepID=UPI002473037A|nr:hypothetical protein [Kitasatospora sp. MAA4]MDH6134307.1 hypothetical protein [Kitasatospora sp. MAA4]
MTRPADTLLDPALFAAELDACHEQAAPGGLVASRSRWVLASRQRTGGGRPVPGGPSGLVAVQHDTPGGERELDVFAGRLLHLHRRAVRAVLDGALARLDQRVSEGATLLNRQLVRGVVADTALALAEAADLLDLPGATAQRRWRIHRDLRAAGRAVIKLHGAAGFQAAGPGRLLHLAELLGNTYLHPGPDGSSVGAADGSSVGSEALDG